VSEAANGLERGIQSGATDRVVHDVETATSGVLCNVRHSRQARVRPLLDARFDDVGVGIASVLSIQHRQHSCRFATRRHRLDYVPLRRPAPASRSGADLALLLLGGYRSLVDAATSELASHGYEDFKPVHEFALRAIVGGGREAAA
jgi:hypothetical protein